MARQDLFRICSLLAGREELIFHFQVKDNYDEREIENLLETLERRGAIYTHLYKGRYRLRIPRSFNWLPFYRTILDCRSVQFTDATTISQRRTICIQPEA